VGKNLHLRQHHPLNTIKERVENYFRSTFLEDGKHIFQTFDNLPARVTTKACFDDLLVPADHPSRAISDTFYFTPEECLRTHTSAHQTQLMQAGHSAFLVTGDCYRRDEIDATHYPVFHQMEGVRVWPGSDKITTEYVMNDLKQALEGMVRTLFGATVQIRWVDAYFPFTEPSLEMEVFYNDKWLEVLGCGAIHGNIMKNIGLGHKKGWAFGIGLERLAMVLFKIPDIRLFWSEDPRFISQFKQGEIAEFRTFSTVGCGIKCDVSMWLADPGAIHLNDFCAVVRDLAGDLVESVAVVDTFKHPKTGRLSTTYRVTYRSFERNITHLEINAIQDQVRKTLAQKFAIELR